MNLAEWEFQYYSKVKEKERRQLLDERIATGEQSEELELIKKLYDQRYTPEKGEEEGVDHMIRGILYLKLLKDRSTLFSFYPKKELKSIYHDFCLETAKPFGETGRKVLYRELKHTSKIFLTLCLEDRAYGSTVLGLIRLSNDALKYKLVTDVYNLTYEIPERFGITEELEVFITGLTDAYNESFPDDRGLLEQKILEGKEKKK